MNIIWYGLNCFRIQFKETVLVSDSFGSGAGIRLFQGQADIVTISRDSDNYNNIKSIKGNPFIINSVGEFDIKGISITGISNFAAKEKKQNEENIIYIYEAEEIKIGHLGNLRGVLSGVDLEKIGQIDVLLVPIGGEGLTIDGERADEIINLIEPKIAIPMHYKTKGLSLKIDGPEKFFKEMGIKAAEKIQKLSLKKKDLMAEETKIVIFEDPNA